VHITAPRVLGLLMFLALIGYTFFIGPWISASTSTRSPASSVPVPRIEPSGGSTPTVPVSPTRSPSRVSAKAAARPSRIPDPAVRPAAVRTLSRAPLLLSRAN
jgi:hypothetical protein